jgi:hypothetical protein
VLGTPVEEEEVDPLYVIPNQTNLLDQIAEVETQNDDTYDDTSIEVTDNQVVQNGSDFDIDLHQSDEIIEDTNEDEENVLTEDELAHQLYGVDNDIEVSIPSVDLDAEEDADWEKLEIAGIITPCAVDDVEAEKEETELVQYTDPAGNTFELPMIKESKIEVAESKMPQEIYDALMDAPEMDVSEVDMSKVTLVDAPEVNTDKVTDATVIKFIQEEVNNIFGDETEITVYLNGDNYDAVTADDQIISVPVAYINNLI